LSRCLFC